MILAGTPAEIRKAAAFVEAIAKIEGEFGYRLGVGTAATLTGSFALEPVTFGPGESFALIRVDDEGPLALAFVPKEG